MVATPIGNLADVTLRALHLLSLVDALACEDTRHTQSMLRAFGIEKPRAGCIALHQHNEVEAAQAVIARLEAGQRVGFVSDAGTPAISDPGARLVAAVRARGFPVVPLPGASSVTTAMSAAGIAGSGDFVFFGFSPSKSAERNAAVARLGAEVRAVVLLEAPHRIEALACALAVLEGRQLTVARELTKQFEQIVTLSCAEFAAWLAADAQRRRGEFVLVLHPNETAAPASDGDRVLAILMGELPLKQAVALTALVTGETRNLLYSKALSAKRAIR